MFYNSPGWNLSFHFLENHFSYSFVLNKFNLYNTINFFKTDKNTFHYIKIKEHRI